MNFDCEATECKHNENNGCAHDSGPYLDITAKCTNYESINDFLAD